MSIDGDGTLDILATNTGTPATAYSHTRLTAGATRYYRVRRGRFTERWRTASCCRRATFSRASSRRALKAEMRARTNDKITQACCRQTGD